MFAQNYSLMRPSQQLSVLVPRNAENRSRDFVIISRDFKFYSISRDFLKG